MASNTPIYSARDEQKLMTEIWDPQIADDPYKFVKFIFPWGKANTPLHHFKEPRAWQCDELQAIGEHIKREKKRIKKGLEPKVYQSATASGRGVGKSALTGWLNMWAMSTRLGATCINTANTEQQLKTRTWAELGKWHTLSLNRHWFDKQALSLKPAPWFGDKLEKQLQIDSTYYYSAAQLWSEENPDAFAGVHNQYGTLVIFDEASGIPEKIWTVTEGFFTDPILFRLWLVFSNPRRNTGSFFACFNGPQRKYWNRRNLDSRRVEGTDKTYLNQIVEKHGDDSDAARVEVKGEFPRQGDQQFISREIIDNALKRELQKDVYAPLIMGVDPARFGDDKTVIRFRQGRDAKSIPAIKLKGADNMEVANTVAHWIQKTNPDAICIDAGNGTGIIDRLRELKYKVHEVWFGSKSSDAEWANNRTHLWAKMRDWLGGGCIDDDRELTDDLAGPEYKFMGRSDKLMLETKEDMKKRGIASPDDGDALACTFDIKVSRRDIRTGRNSVYNQNRFIAKDIDYQFFK